MDPARFITFDPSRSFVIGEGKGREGRRGEERGEHNGYIPRKIPTLVEDDMAQLGPGSVV